jgi:hypothetical protein
MRRATCQLSLRSSWAAAGVALTLLAKPFGHPREVDGGLA